MIRNSAAWILVVLMSLGLMSACSTNNAAVSPDLPAIDQNADYSLGTGDQLRITVFGAEDLSREVEVDSAGRISLPLVGDLLVVGRTPKHVEQMVVEALKPDYYTNPIVSVEVLVYRDLFIIGEIANPGPYPYAGGMRVINIVAMAGGFTYRAVEDEFIISRDGKQYRGGQETAVLPGDVIEVRERFF